MRISNIHLAITRLSRGFFDLVTGALTFEAGDGIKLEEGSTIIIEEDT